MFAVAYIILFSDDTGTWFTENTCTNSEFKKNMQQNMPIPGSGQMFTQQGVVSMFK